jgi:SAM-dependent methyltransferase
MSVSLDDVRTAYRFILGREPESEEAVVNYQRHFASFEDLRRNFLFSEELRIQLIERWAKDSAAGPELGQVLLTAPAQAIETNADPSTLRAMIAKIAAAWEVAGETVPYFSVLSYDAYRPERFAENECSFFESGKIQLDQLLALLRRIGRPPEVFNRCLEYGCGVGRVTAQLARAFSEVIALDISGPHLRLAQAYLKQLGYTNVTFQRVTAENLHPGADYDLWFSFLVLQHNPPPLTLAILDRGFAGLAPQGVAVVHVPTYWNGYSFNVSDYMAEKLPPEHLHMHATPQKPILELAWKHGCCLLDVREEGPSSRLTNFFVFQKVKPAQSSTSGSKPAFAQSFSRCIRYIMANFLR